MAVFATIEKTQISKDLLLKSNQYAGKKLLIGYCVAFKTVGHNVVDVLNKDHVGVDVVKILDKSAMTARTEQQRAVGIAERSVVGISGNSVGAWLLLRERDVIVDAELGNIKCLSYRLLSAQREPCAHG